MNFRSFYIYLVLCLALSLHITILSNIKFDTLYISPTLTWVPWNTKFMSHEFVLDFIISSHKNTSVWVNYFTIINKKLSSIFPHHILQLTTIQHWPNKHGLFCNTNISGSLQIIDEHTTLYIIIIFGCIFIGYSTFTPKEITTYIISIYNFIFIYNCQTCHCTFITLHNQHVFRIPHYFNENIWLCKIITVL